MGCNPTQPAKEPGIAQPAASSPGGQPPGYGKWGKPDLPKTLDVHLHANRTRLSNPFRTPRFEIPGQRGRVKDVHGPPRQTPGTT